MRVRFVLTRASGHTARELFKGGRNILGASDFEPVDFDA
jgi:hypothetical protein